MSYFFNEAARVEHLEHVANYESCQIGLGARYLLAFDEAMGTVCEAPDSLNVRLIAMGTTASLYPAVDAAAVWSRLPLRYRTSVGIAALGIDPIDLLVFETGERHVVTLEDLMKSINGIESPSMRLAVIGFDFTEEARIRIRSLGGRIFAEQNVWD